jgi:peroxin-6
MTGHPLVIVGTTSEDRRVPHEMLGCFKHIVEFEVRQHDVVILHLILRYQAPREEERLEILQCLLAQYNLASDVSLPHIATHTAALVAADLRDLVLRAQVASMFRVG